MVALTGYLDESGSPWRRPGRKSFARWRILNSPCGCAFQGPLGAEQVARISNLLDEAAKGVEGS